ncbi:Hypothetical predicted protein, partial [Paramuricea clavata]
MADLSCKIYEERHGVEVSSFCILEAMRILVTAQPYKPLLWKLYSTCQYLYSLRPASFARCEVRVDDYVCREIDWISGDTDEICDVILVDDLEKKRICERYC